LASSTYPTQIFSRQGKSYKIVLLIVDERSLGLELRPDGLLLDVGSGQVPYLQIRVGKRAGFSFSGMARWRILYYREYS
jgi:hypothetical protein